MREAYIRNRYNVTGNCTLRDAIAATGAGGTITFSAAVFPAAGPAKTITLTQGQLTITRAVAITGPGSHLLTINGNGASRDLLIQEPAASPPPSGGIRPAAFFTATISGITFTGGAVAGNGGGILVDFGAALTGDDLVVRGNTATSGGGIAVNGAGGGAATLTNSTVSGNTATGGGAGFANGGTLALTNVTISGNETNGDGGGIRNDGTTTLVNVTISRNRGTGSGGGGGVYNGGTLNATNTIIAGSLGFDDLRGPGTLGTNTNNLIATFMAPINPLLAPLGLYGGTKETQPPLPGSPAIDTGTNTGCPAADERGGTRPVNTTCDIGAVESRGFTLAITSGNNQTVNANANFAPLVVTVTGNFVDGTMTTREPVLNGQVTFTPPVMGAGATLVTSPATIMAGGVASVNATANGTGGAFTVPVSASGVANGVVFNLAILAPNAPPTVDALMPVTILEDSGATTVNLTGITAGPANDAGQTVTVTATSDTPGTVPNPTVMYTSPNGTGALVFTPVANAFGTATITVTVADSGGTMNGGVNTASRTFLVTVTPVNDAPTLDALPNRTLPINGGAQSVPLSGITVGPANENTQTLTVTATSSNTALIPNPTVTYTSANATGTLTFTPATGQTGMATITVTVTDSGGTANNGVDTTTRTFTVTVNPATVTGVTLTQMGASVAGGQASVPAGGTVTFTPMATFSDGSMRAVAGSNWTISDPTKGTLDQNGRVTTYAPGTVTITTTYMGPTGSFTLVITPPSTGGLMPNPAPVARPDAATAPALPTPLPAPPTRAAAPGGGIAPQANGEATPAPRPAPPMR